MCQSKGDEPIIKSVNLINNSKMPGQYHVQYDWTNCPIKCHPSFGVIQNRIQIKLELKPIKIGYYYKRLYILIAYHHPVYIDIYAFSGTMIGDPFSYFKSPFGPLPKPKNNYIEFFKDVAHPRNDVQHRVIVSPKELRFGYARNTKTLKFNVHNDSDTTLFINWIHEPSSDNPFTISPKQFYIDSHDTKKLKCTFRPKIVPNIYFVEFEANVYFGTTNNSRLLAMNDAFQNHMYVVPMNISLTVAGHSSDKPFNGWKSTCKLKNRVIVMPPTVPASTPVFATLLIKKIVYVPTTFELRPPNKSMFLAKPMMGMINSDYQIVVFQLMKTSNKESLYAERWDVIFDGFDNNLISIDIYASAEFGCVTIGEWNHVVVPDDVQVGCDMWNGHIPIVNMTRHRLRYCIEMNSQHHSVNNEVIEFPPDKRRYSWSLGAKEEIDDEEIGVEYTDYYTELEIDAGTEMDVGSEMIDDGSNKNAKSEMDAELKKYAKPKKNAVPEKDTGSEYDEPKRKAGPDEDNEYSSMNQSYDEYSINSTTVSVKKFERLSSMLRGEVKRCERTTPWPFVFSFDKLVGELGPNERRNLRLSFRPTECLTYTADATCYLTCDHDDYPEIFNALPVTIQGTGCKTRFQVTPENCNLNNVIINMERIQRFIIENKNRSYAKIKIVTIPTRSMIWSTSICKLNPETFLFTPQQNQCKIDLSIYPTELGFQKFFINIQFDPKVESYQENDFTITVSMNVITCKLQILKISNDSIPYFGRLTLNKLFHCLKINNKLDEIYTKNTSPLIWTIPAISESTTFDIQLYNFSKIPISWGIKYSECIKCTSKNKNNNNNNNHKNCRSLSNKCEHYKSINITPTVNLKMNNFSKIQIELNTITKDEINLNYKWSIGFYKSLLYNTELLIKPKTFKDGLISFDPKYGTADQLEFNFLPVFIAHHNPPAQAFWVYNSNNCDVTYSIIDDSLTPAHPYFRCLNPNGVFSSKSVHPILFVFSPNRLCAFEATIMLLTNNYYRRQITLLGQGESYTRTTISPGHGLSSFLPMQNDRKIFLSTENIILKPILTQSNTKSLFCLYNNSDEEIIYEWNECTVDKILTAIICPIKGNLKKYKSQIFEMSITSYNEPAILTIMLNISYKLVSQIENYERSLKNYNINKNRLEGYFIINECGNYKPKLNMKIEKQPQEKYLVLYAYVRIIDEFSKWINEAKHNIKKHNFQQDKRIIKQKLVCTDNFRNILWDVVDKICSKEIDNKPLYYYQLKNSKQNYQNDISKTTRNNLETILTSLIRDSLINIFPSNTWKH
ncbi:LOW QUALITY PROTEIN: uncharacterized protein LOC112595057 [Melanaphis sacchari]|uniref:LOW QUALITY PROTEIN: uncharacterized protein LOC112595057 n=1 Tax=Melanaphis sacchari TaxID=742174 RepID=UPI000DC13D95|nr:LOW QUALITY PROTEIN: uncharacterized protein LOC112595057 [Melanaphis sacchari]